MVPKLEFRRCADTNQNHNHNQNNIWSYFTPRRPMLVPGLIVRSVVCRND